MSVSVVSVAVYVTASSTTDETVNVTWPAASVLPPPVIVELPPPWASVTVLPAIGLPPASRSVTVIVEVSVPLLTTVTGLAPTVESASLTGPAAIA